MNLPFEYDRVAVGEFGGTTPTTTDFEHARVVILPIPLDRTTSYVAGHAQRPARDSRRVVAHGAVGRGNRHRRPQHRHLHAAGDGVSVRDAWTRSWARSGASPSELVDARQVSVRPRRRALDHAAGRRARSPNGTPGCRCCRSTRTPTCATRSWARRTTMRARCAACSSSRRRRRWASAACRRRKPPPIPSLRDARSSTTSTCATIRDWIDRVVDSLSDTVYITIDVDGLDPAIMPATGTPEPGGLSWYETLALLRRVIERADRRRLRSRGAVADARQRRAELPLREADLQDPVVPVRRERRVERRVTPSARSSSASRARAARRR